MLKAALRKIKQEVRLAGLTQVAKTVSREKITFLTPDKLKLLESEVRNVIKAGVKGDILEFGLAWGGSAAVISQQATTDHPYHGFDVFSMIPPPTSEKDDDFSRERYEVIKAGKAEGFGGNEYYGYRKDLFGDVNKLLDRFGRAVDNKTVFLHKGLFEETWPHYKGASVAFAHIDCDWYDPVKYCLENVGKLMPVGAVMIIDDYPEFGGCKTATDEFLAEHGDKFRAEMKARLVIRRVA